MRKTAHDLKLYCDAFHGTMAFSNLLPLCVLAVMAGLLSASEWPYLQIYPPLNETDGRTPLFLALALSFGGTFKSIGVLPGVQVALDYINSEPALLPGYTLHYTLTDSQVLEVQNGSRCLQDGSCSHTNSVGFFLLSFKYSSDLMGRRPIILISGSPSALQVNNF